MPRKGTIPGRAAAAGPVDDTEGNEVDGAKVRLGTHRLPHRRRDHWPPLQETQLYP